MRETKYDAAGQEYLLDEVIKIQNYLKEAYSRADSLKIALQSLTNTMAFWLNDGQDLNRQHIQHVYDQLHQLAFGSHPESFKKLLTHPMPKEIKEIFS